MWSNHFEFAAARSAAGNNQLFGYLGYHVAVVSFDLCGMDANHVPVQQAVHRPAFRFYWGGTYL